MSVILLILKIIGIVLATVCGLFVLLLLAALFYPAGYRITGHFEDELHLRVRLHWLFYLVFFTYRMEGERQSARLWIFGIPFQIYPPKEKKRRRNRKIKNTSQEETTHIPLQAAPVSDVTVDVVSKVSDVTEKTEDTGRYTSRLVRFTDRCRQKLKAVCGFFQGVPERLRQVGKNFSGFREAITDERNQSAFKLILRELKSLLLHYRPRKLTADIRYGLGDPALTGQSLAILSMFPFLYQKKVQIIPDFEAEQLFVKGKLDAVGHIRLMHLIRSGIHIWKDKNCRTVISKWKN